MWGPVCPGDTVSANALTANLAAGIAFRLANGFLEDAIDWWQDLEGWQKGLFIAAVAFCIVAMVLVWYFDFPAVAGTAGIGALLASRSLAERTDPLPNLFTVDLPDIESHILDSIDVHTTEIVVRKFGEFLPPRYGESVFDEPVTPGHVFACVRDRVGPVIVIVVGGALDGVVPPFVPIVGADAAGVEDATDAGSSTGGYRGSRKAKVETSRIIRVSRSRSDIDATSEADSRCSQVRGVAIGSIRFVTAGVGAQPGTD